MGLEFRFDSEHEFMDKLRELTVQSGLTHEDVTTFTPYPVHGLEEVLGEPASGVKFFTLTGGVSGFLTGLIFTIYTVSVWPLTTGGKPLISLPPFILIAYVLTILFGSLASLVGFLLLARLPDVRQVLPAEEYGNQFVIVVKKEKE